MIIALTIKRNVSGYADALEHTSLKLTAELRFIFVRGVMHGTNLNPVSRRIREP